MVVQCCCFRCCQNPEEKIKHAQKEKKKDRLRSARIYELIGSAVPVFIAASFASLSERLIEYWAGEEEGKGGTSIKDKEFVLTLFYMVFTVISGLALAVFIIPSGEADDNAAAKARSKYLSGVPVVGRVLVALRRFNLSDFAGSVVTENAGFATKNFFVSLILKGIFEGHGLLSAFLAFCGQVVVLTCFILFGDRLYLFFNCSKKDVEGIMSFHIDSCSLCIAYIANVIIAFALLQIHVNLFGKRGLLFSWQDEHRRDDDAEESNSGDGDIFMGMETFIYSTMITSVIAIWQIIVSKDTTAGTNVICSTSGEDSNEETDSSKDKCTTKEGKKEEITRPTFVSSTFEIVKEDQSTRLSRMANNQYNTTQSIVATLCGYKRRNSADDRSVTVGSNHSLEEEEEKGEGKVRMIWGQFSNVIIGDFVGVIWFAGVLSISPYGTNQIWQLIFVMLVAAIVTRQVPRMLAKSDYKAIKTEDKIRKQQRFLVSQRAFYRKESCDSKSASTNCIKSKSSKKREAATVGEGERCVVEEEEYTEAIPRRTGAVHPASSFASTASSCNATTVVSVLAQPLSHVVADEVEEGRYGGNGGAVDYMQGENPTPNDNEEDDDDTEEMRACNTCCCCSCCFSSCPRVCLFFDKLGYLLTKIGHQKGAIKRSAIR